MKKGKGGRRGRPSRSASFPPEKPDAGALEAFRARLGELGFGEEPIAARLGIPHPAALELERYPVYLGERLDLARPLDALIGLFLLQAEAPRPDVERALGASLTAALVDGGWLDAGARAGKRLRAVASLHPCLGAWFATDPRYRSLEPRDRRPPGEPVMYLGGDSYALACATVRRPVEAALDLCTGSGVHAILAARHARRVVAVDLSPRAVRFARFNAALNGVASKVTVLEGDLDAPVEAGARFDLILSNPPFVPSPAPLGKRLAFRDAGSTGEDVLAELVRRIPRRLGRDGLALVVTTFVDEAGRPFRRKLEQWLGPANEQSSLVLRYGVEAPGDYAVAQARAAVEERPGRYEARLATWLRALARARIERVGGGVLVLKPAPGPTPPWHRELSPPAGLKPYGEAVERALKGCDVARSVVFRDEVFERQARAAPDIVFQDESRRAPDGRVATTGHRVVSPSSLGGEVGVSAELRVLLGRAAESPRPLRALIEEAAGDRGEAFEATAARLLDDLLELVERGLLILGKA